MSMSSFFGHTSADLNEAKKRVGNTPIMPSGALIGGALPATSSTAADATASNNKMIMSTTEDGTESSPGGLESWVELAPSRASFCSSVEAVMMEDPNVAITTGDISIKDSRLSPVSLQSPNVEFESNLEQVKFRLAKDVLPKSGEWVWDWSSRPEAAPPSSSNNEITTPHSHIAASQQHPNINNNGGSNGSSGKRLPYQMRVSPNVSGVVGSALTTPPNSPEPDLLVASHFDFSGRRLKSAHVQKRSLLASFWRFEVFVGLVVSNLMTFMLGATIGFCICKKISKNDAPNDVFKINYSNYW